jgi:hypothetical protein
VLLAQSFRSPATMSVSRAQILLLALPAVLASWLLRPAAVGFTPEAWAAVTLSPPAGDADGGAVLCPVEREVALSSECIGENAEATNGAEARPPAKASASAEDTADTTVAEPHREPVTGTVFGPDGVPCAMATVRMADVVAASGSDGMFSLAVPARVAAGTPLFVIASACIPVAMPDPRPVDGRPPLPLTVLLRTGVAITGRIVAENGVPLRGWVAVLADTTPFAAESGNTTAEGQLGALRAVTDTDGAFRFDGVFDRSYVIEAWDERGTRALRAAVAPMDGFVSLVAAERTATTLHGVVVDAADRPVPGAIVGVARAGAAAAGALSMRFDQRVTTGPDGRFAIPLRGAALYVIVDAAGVVPCRVAIPSLDGSASPLRVQVVRRRDA